jgi:hypothetical protein
LVACCGYRRGKGRSNAAAPSNRARRRPVRPSGSHPPGGTLKAMGLREERGQAAIEVALVAPSYSE